MENEIVAIEKNRTWELTTLVIGSKKIGVKCVSKTKIHEKRKVGKCKARLVAKRV